MNLYHNLAVLYEGQGDLAAYQKLAEKFSIPLYEKLDSTLSQTYFFTLRESRLTLVEKGSIKKSGLAVEIEHRPGEQASWPIAKTGVFARALGKKTRSIVDATAGWGQDSLAMFRMGYDVISIERSAVMAELLADGFKRLQQLEWVRQLNLAPPTLLVGDAVEVLQKLEFAPDCVYLDPMFPPKRKKSALPKKSMTVLRDLVGDDLDKMELFMAALKVTGKRVVVKCPVFAEPLGGKPSESFQGKLLRYDVYLKS